MISGQIRMMIKPPEWWPEFQELTLDLCNIRWPNAVNEIYGREGQKQKGIDITSRDEMGLRGVECKKRRQPKKVGDRVPAGGSLTEKKIDAIIEKADKEGLPLKRLYIATTLPRDTCSTNYLGPLNSERASSGRFMVEVWPWEEFQRDICDSSTLLHRYYAKVIKSDPTYSPEKHLLSLLRSAFMRPAFNTPLAAEDSSEGFEKAIAVTQYALADGRLRERTNYQQIVASAPFGFNQMKADSKLYQGLEEIHDRLQTVRDEFTKAMKEGRIVDTPWGPKPEWIVASKIDIERGLCIKRVNELLALEGLDLVKSQLIFFAENA